MEVEENEKGITLAVETLENKDVLFNKLGIFFLLSTNIEKIIAEYISDRTKDESFRDKSLGLKETEFNRITASHTLKRYIDIKSKLKDFKKRRNDITHKTLIINPKHFAKVLYINWRNTEVSDEISVESYMQYVNDSIVLARDLLADLVTLFLYEDLEDEKFIEARAMTAKMPFGFHNKHC